MKLKINNENKRKSLGAGNTYITVLIILTVAIIATLAFVFYKNFMSNKTSNNETVLSDNKSTETEDMKNDSNSARIAKNEGFLVFNDEVSGVSFEYPSGWSVARSSDNDSGEYNRMFYVTDSGGKQVAQLGYNIVIAGGGTDTHESTTYSVLRATKTNIINYDNEAVYAGFITKKLDSGGFAVLYGLSSRFTDIKDYDVIDVFSNSMYFAANAIDNHNILISFGIGTSNRAYLEFSTLVEVKAYMNSDGYKNIEIMLGSLEY